MPSHLISPTDLPNIPETKIAQIEELHQLLRLGKATLTSPNGSHQLELPDPLYRLLLQIIGDISKGRPVAYLSANQDLTTQQAANSLGMSRQFFVNLLDRGEISYHRVGTHRRVSLRDVLAYRKQRDIRRHEPINKLAKQAAENDMYDDF